MEKLSKLQEIKLLEKLQNGDGYFADCFGNDIAQMISNIKDDFFLISQTEIEKKIYQSNDAVDRACKEVEKLKEQIKTLTEINEGYEIIAVLHVEKITYLENKNLTLKVDNKILKEQKTHLINRLNPKIR